MQTKIDGHALLLIELYLFLVVSAFVNFGIIPSSVLYIFDLINLMVFIVSFKHVRTAFSCMKWQLTLVEILLLYCFVSAAISFVAPQYVMWELNAVFRVFVFLFIWVSVCSLEDLKGLLRILYRIQILNFLAACIEFFSLGLQGDNCGGLFGIVSGCNAYTNIYLCVVCGYAMNSYLSHDGVKSAGLILSCLAALVVATLGEIKFFYFEFVIMLLVSTLSNKFTIKTILTIAFSVVILAFGLSLLSVYYPASYELLFDVDAIAAYDDGSHYATSGYGISRSAPVSQIDTIIFSNDVSEKAFGMGFGSAAVSSVDFFATPFYRDYGYLRYYYSPIAMIYVQIGWVGIILYFSFFFCMTYYAISLRARFRSASPGLYGFTLVVLAMFILNCFYNASSRASIAILWAVVLSATVFISQLKQGN